MNKRFLIIAAIVAAVIIVAAFFISKKPGKPGNAGPVLGQEIQLLNVLSADGNPTRIAIVRVPFLRTAAGEPTLKVAVDLNKDNTFQDSEWIVNGVHARTAKDWDNNFYFTVDPQNVSGANVRVELGSESVEKVVPFTPIEVASLVDFSKVTKPEEAMLGGVQLAQTMERPGTGSNEGVPNTFRSDTPDIAQRPDECAPTSAANSLISLAGDHGRIDAIPRDPYAFIDQLKSAMNWSQENGVTVDDFVAGKNKIAQDLNLPVKTTIIGAKNGQGTYAALREALAKQSAAELRLVFRPAGVAKVIGGHMVTVTGVDEVNGHQFINIHDPLSPSGTDTYELNGTQLMNYGDPITIRGGNGETSIGVGFVQTWDTKKIKAINVNGKYVPLCEVYVAKADKCDAEHYHGLRSGAAKAIDDSLVPETQGHCGFGKVASTPIVEVEVPSNFPCN